MKEQMDAISAVSALAKGRCQAFFVKRSFFHDMVANHVAVLRSCCECSRMLALKTRENALEMFGRPLKFEEDLTGSLH